MAKLETETQVTYVLTLDAEEAGYLKDLLSAHIAGGMTSGVQPLGRIRVALADVERMYLYDSRADATNHPVLWRSSVEAGYRED